LDFTTVPLSLNVVVGETTIDDTETALFSLLATEEEGKAGSVGLELSTELLRHCELVSLNSKQFKNIKISSQLMYSFDKLRHVLDSLHSKGLLSVILCPCNSFTLPVALMIKQWVASKSDVTFFASEVLRAHPRSPGLLVTPASANAGIGRLPDMPMTEAVELFQKTANTCIHFEKNFLKKVRC
jgi:hypothetical protein